MAVREARLANPAAFDEEKTWYRRHTKPHTTAEWGTPQEQWAAESDAVAEKRARDLPVEDVGLGGSVLWGAEEAGDVQEGGEDY